MCVFPWKCYISSWIIQVLHTSKKSWRIPPHPLRTTARLWLSQLQMYCSFHHPSHPSLFLGPLSAPPGRPKTDSHLNEASNEYSEEEIKALWSLVGLVFSSFCKPTKHHPSEISCLLLFFMLMVRFYFGLGKKGRLALDNVSCSSSSLAAVYSTRGTPPHLMRKYSR